MLQRIDSLERSQNSSFGGRATGIKGIPANEVFIPRYARYLIPAMLLGICLFGASLLGILVIH